MVWGVLTPVGFGQFFPHGEFDDEKSFYPEADKYKLDLGPVSEAMQPRTFRIVRGGKSLAAMIESMGGLLLVAEEVRRAIERVEPGVHQFWPVEVFHANGERSAYRYHALVIRQFRDAVIEEKSDVRVRSDSGNLSCHPTKANAKALTLSSERIGDAHLWRDERLLSVNVFMSNALQSAIAETGLKIMPHARTKIA